MFHNWLAGPKPYARRVVTGVIAPEAKRLYHAHVDRSDLVDDATSRSKIDEHAMLVRSATRDEYEDFLADTLRSTSPATDADESRTAS